MLFTVAECPSNVELLGDGEIKKDEVGYYECRVLGVDIQWSVNGIPFSFQGSLPAGSIVDTVPNTIAVLLENPDQDPTVPVNRTSTLRYKPDPGPTSSFTIVCGGGSVGSCDPATISVSKF